MASFDRVISQQSGSQLKPVPARSPVLAKGTGAIRGTVKDESGAVIPKAIVHATLKLTSRTLTTLTGTDGTYTMRALDPGEYDVSIAATGFMASRVSGVPVLAEQETELDVTLTLGAFTQIVEVQASPPELQTASAGWLSGVVAGPPPPPPQGVGYGGGRGIAGGIGTPRLREYFPETLVWEIEGMLERPYGCGEQIISSAYPGLLRLRYYKLSGHADPALEARARRYLELGYDRLLSYRVREGGFNYWGHGDADVALTAYALRFLEDASEFLTVDPEAKQRARGWLVKQQQKDGRWIGHRWSGNSQEDSKQTALLTAYLARVLAALPAEKSIATPKPGR